MKQVVYRDILGGDPRKHEVSVEERFDHSEKVLTKRWACKYFIEEKYYGKERKDLEAWIEMKKRNCRKKNCHLLRSSNELLGQNKVICKVLGDFFLIVGRMAYKIVYVNEVKIDIKDMRKVA